MVKLDETNKIINIGNLERGSVSEKRQLTVNQMRAGQSGIVVNIMGGHGAMKRLQSMGIRPGKQITKVSSMFMHGPVTLQVDRTQIAIGYGMASKILVEAT
jgi:ferrous iron transport protein A